MFTISSYSKHNTIGTNQAEDWNLLRTSAGTRLSPEDSCVRKRQTMEHMFRGHKAVAKAYYDLRNSLVTIGIQI